MNRRNSQNNKLLLDTSFLLPILGFETSKTIMDVFQKLDRYVLYYSDISILEALWRIVKKINGSEEGVMRIVEGIKAIRDTMNNITVNEESIKDAIDMYNLGHKDMIDNLLYSLAETNKLKLLTVDKELIKFIEEYKLQEETIITPEKIE